MFKAMIELAKAVGVSFAHAQPQKKGIHILGTTLALVVMNVFQQVARAALQAAR